MRCAFAPGATTMVFSAAASTTMAAAPLGPGTVDHAVQADVVGAQVGAQLTAAASSPSGRDQLDRGAGAGRGDGLVAALAARRRRQRRGQHGFAGPRQCIAPRR